MTEAVKGEHFLIGVVQPTGFPASPGLRYPKIGMESLPRLTVNGAKTPKQIRGRHDYEVRLVFREGRQDENPEVSLGILIFSPGESTILRPPVCLQEECALSRVEVLRELDLKRDRACVAVSVTRRSMPVSLLGPTHSVSGSVPR